MIEILNVDHFCQAVPNLEKQSNFLQKVLGLVPSKISHQPGFDNQVLSIPGSSRLGWELMSPNADDSFLHRFLDGARGPGLHHLTMRVTSIRDTKDQLLELGYEPWGVEQNVAYLHPQKGGQGFLFQFYEASDENVWYDTEPFADSKKNTIGIKSVDHIAHAHQNVGELVNWYHSTFGFSPYTGDSVNTSSGEEFKIGLLQLPSKQLKIEIIAPAHSESFVQKFLNERDTSVHHLTLEVEDWNRATAALAFHGIRTFGERSNVGTESLWNEAFIHPKETDGVLLQIFWQAKPGLWE
ncbi:MAG: VOC family protein [Dehalococcoidia bacterium]|nr:VOC family protein [Dehalococcoidia bacterium]